MGWSLESKGTDLISCKWHIGEVRVVLLLSLGLFGDISVWRSDLTCSLAPVSP